MFCNVNTTTKLGVQIYTICKSNTPQTRIYLNSNALSKTQGITNLNASPTQRHHGASKHKIDLIYSLDGFANSLFNTLPFYSYLHHLKELFILTSNRTTVWLSVTLAAHFCRTRYFEREKLTRSSEFTFRITLLIDIKICCIL